MIGIFELIVIVMLACIITVPFTIFAIIDVLRNDFQGNSRIVWLLVLVFLSLPGLILYRVIGKKQKVAK